MTPQEKTDALIRATLQAIARKVEAQLPERWGFVILSFPFEPDGQMNYISNADRADVVRVMYEFIETTKGQWGQDQPVLSSAEEDQHLGWARQRIAQLEEELRKAREGT